MSTMSRASHEKLAELYAAASEIAGNDFGNPTHIMDTSTPVDLHNASMNSFELVRVVQRPIHAPYIPTATTPGKRALEIMNEELVVAGYRTETSYPALETALGLRAISGLHEDEEKSNKSLAAARKKLVTVVEEESGAAKPAQFDCHIGRLLGKRVVGITAGLNELFEYEVEGTFFSLEYDFEAGAIGQTTKRSSLDISIMPKSNRWGYGTLSESYARRFPLFGWTMRHRRISDRVADAAISDLGQIKDLYFDLRSGFEHGTK